MLSLYHDKSQLAHHEPSETSEPEMRGNSDRPGDSAHTIAPALRRGLPSYAQRNRHQRPGWKFSPGAPFSNQMKDNPSDICIECYATGHKTPNFLIPRAGEGAESSSFY